MQQRSIAIALSVEGADFHIGATIHWADDRVEDPPVVWFCLPGADFTRRYYDLRLGTDLSRSFAVAMTDLGHIVVTIDPLGIGDSDTVAERHGYDVDFIIRAHGAAIAAIEHQLADGSSGSPQIGRGAIRIGLGHSMGGMLVILQQAAFETFDGIALLGTSLGGLNTLLNEAEREYAENPAGARAAIGELAKIRFGSAFLKVAPDGAPPSAFAGEDDIWTQAVAATGRAGVVSAAATLCMLPGGFSEEAASIFVPTFIGIGDADLPMPVHEAPAALAGCDDVTLLLIRDTGHMHFGFSSAPALFGRLAHWSAICR